MSIIPEKWEITITPEMRQIENEGDYQFVAEVSDGCSLHIITLNGRALVHYVNRNQGWMHTIPVIFTFEQARSVCTSIFGLLD